MMKQMREVWFRPDPNSYEVIATFGEAKLVRQDFTKYELVGGSKADRAEAREWVSQFLKGVAVKDQRTDY
jgi:hypothetical protein